jgi:hypothetical protein
MLAQAVDDPAGVFSGQPSENVRQLRIPGDLIIGGVFPVHAKGGGGTSPCGEIFETRGVHRVEAFLYALDMINAQTEFLRGYKLVSQLYSIWRIVLNLNNWMKYNLCINLSKSLFA